MYAPIPEHFQVNPSQCILTLGSVRLPDGQEGISAYTEDLLAFLKQHCELHALHPEDYFITPPAPVTCQLIAALRDVVPDEVVNDITGFVHEATHWRGAWNSHEAPSAVKALHRTSSDELRTFYDTVRNLSLTRVPVNLSSKATSDTSLLNHPSVTAGMCPKKRHEVSQMQQLVSNMCRSHGADTVVNVGEGKGYVSRFLALEHDLQMIGLDCNPQHGDTSAARVERMLDQTTDGYRYRRRGGMRSITCTVNEHTDIAGVANSAPQDLTSAVSPVRKMRCVACGVVLKGGPIAQKEHLRVCRDGEYEEYGAGDGDTQWPRGAQFTITIGGSRRVVRVVSYDSGTKKHRVTDSEGGTVAVNFSDPAVNAQVMEEVQASCPPIAADMSNAMMMGLHACGNLGSDTLRLFVRSSSPALALVSCCWHALTPQGFPLSRRYRQPCLESGQPAWRQFSNVSTMLATQPMDAWGTGGAGMSLDSLRILFYRSLLPLTLPIGKEETTREQQDCSFRGQQTLLKPAFLRRIAKQKQTLDFTGFVREVCVEYYGGPTDDLLAKATHLYTEKADHFKDFVCFAMLRMWIAPLVEGSLLLDRLWYLKESLPAASQTALLPLFDGTLSPRMFALVARRA
jgi:hypothetical protein